MCRKKDQKALIFIKRTSKMKARSSFFHHCLKSPFSPYKSQQPSRKWLEVLPLARNATVELTMCGFCTAIIKKQCPNRYCPHELYLLPPHFSLLLPHWEIAWFLALSVSVTGNFEPSREHTGVIFKYLAVGFIRHPCYKTTITAIILTGRQSKEWISHQNLTPFWARDRH